jgi:hypothetical protein
MGVKQLGCEADHSALSAEVKECVELYLHSPNMPSWHGDKLQHRDNFTFTFILFVIINHFIVIMKYYRFCLRV